MTDTAQTTENVVTLTPVVTVVKTSTKKPAKKASTISVKKLTQKATAAKKPAKTKKTAKTLKTAAKVVKKVAGGNAGHKAQTQVPLATWTKYILMEAKAEQIRPADVVRRAINDYFGIKE